MPLFFYGKERRFWGLQLREAKLAWSQYYLFGKKIRAIIAKQLKGVYLNSIRFPPPLAISLVSAWMSIHSQPLAFRIVQHDVWWWISTHQLRVSKLCSPRSHLWKVGHAASNQSACEYVVFTFALGIGASFAHLVKQLNGSSQCFVFGRIYWKYLKVFLVVVFLNGCNSKTCFAKDELLTADV